MICATIIIASTIVLFVWAMVLRANEMEKRNIIFGGREFNVYCESQFSGSMCVVNIYEVAHPNRKFFREKYRGSKSFWIGDYDTIKQGIYAMLDALEKDEEEEAKRIAKWKELDNDN